MGTINYDNLDRSQLLSILKEIPLEIKKRDKDMKKDLREKMHKLAEQAGYSLDEVLDNKKNKPTKKAAPKYQNPEDDSITWTGRGRKPLWIIAALESGSSLEDLAIK